MAINVYIHYPTRGGGGSGTAKAGSASLAASDQEVSVVFGAPFGSNNYRAVPVLRNTTDVDDDLQFLSMLITAKAASGFTVRLNAPVATANYAIDYVAEEDA